MSSRNSPWLRSFVSSRSRGDGDPALEKELASLEADVERAVSGYRGTPLNRAGDLCFKAAQKDRALGYYGRAIDAFLEDGQLESARGVGLKIIRLHPGAVRTLCTLTWLDMAAGHAADALEHLRSYVESVLRGGNQNLARQQIRKMAAVTSDPEIRRAAAEALRGIGDREAAAEVEEWVASGWNDEAAETPEDLRTRCFAAALQSGRK